MDEPQVILKRGRDGPVRGGHPWVFSGAVASIEGGPEPGEIVRVRAADGTLLGRGTVSSAGAIAVRLFSRTDEPVDSSFVQRRVERALELRSATVTAGTDAYRLINGEGDGLPGIVVDWYAGVAVVQYLTAGAERMASWVDAALAALCRPSTIYERSEGSVRRTDGLRDRCGERIGGTAAEPLGPNPISIAEHGRRFLVDVERGQKTGFFLDQRDNRTLTQEISAGREVLNLFAYTGGFAVAAALGGASHVVSVETSRPALELAERNWRHNELPPEKGAFVCADAFAFLRDGRESVDVVILDPPAFAKRRRDVGSAVRGYREINRQAMLRLRPGGWMLTCSCSHHVTVESFRSTVLAAANDAKRSVQVVRPLGAGADHPVLLAHGEGGYLKGFLVRVLA